MKGLQLGLPVLLLTGSLFYNIPVGSCTALSLEDAIHLALARNTSLAITKKGEDTADAALRSAKGNNSFSVTANSRLNTAKNSDSDRSDAFNNSLSASLPIYSGGKNEASIESSEFGLKAALLKTERQRENLKLSVIQSYYNAVQSKKTIAVCQEAVDNFDAHYTNVNQLYSAGSKARVDVLRASVELSNARYLLISAKNDYEVKLAILRNYLNMDREEPLELTEDFTYDQFTVPLTDCLEYAYGHRKDLLIDLYTLEQKELAVKMAKAAYYPSVSLSVGGNTSSTHVSSWNSNAGLSAGITANWNIFDSGITGAAVDSAKTALEVAQLTFDNDRETVDLNLRQSYYSMRSAEHQLQSTADAVSQAEEDYFIAREKYRAGEGIMLDVLDAQKSLSDAQLNHIEAQFDFMRYRAAVENSMGIGLTEEEHRAAESLLPQSVEVTDPTPAVREMEARIAEEKQPAEPAASDTAAPAFETAAEMAVQGAGEQNESITGTEQAMEKEAAE